MNRLAAAALAALLCAPALAADKPAAKKDAPAAAAAPAKAEGDENTLYALGLLVGKNFAELGLSKAELETVKKGITDQVTGAKPRVELADYQAKIQEFAKKRHEVSMEKVKGESKGFLEKAAAESGAQRFPSGLIYKSLKAGSGPSPTAADKVKVNYEGKLTNGTVFDSSYTRGQPISFPLNGVIKCWTEGVQKMKVGETAQLVCPSDIAYGDNGHPPTIPGGATLVFKVDLIAIEK